MAASDHLNSQQFPPIKDVSDFTRSSKDKTFARQRTTRLLREKSGETVAPPAPSGSASNATSQRVLDAWKKRAAG